MAWLIVMALLLVVVVWNLPALLMRGVELEHFVEYETMPAVEMSHH